MKAPAHHGAPLDHLEDQVLDEEADGDHREQAGEHRGDIERVLALIDEPAEAAIAGADAEDELGRNQRALDGGCDSIEHGLQISDAQIAQMLKQGTWYCPTISVYYTDWSPADTPDGQRDRLRASAHEESFRKALKAGVKIVFGTDMGGIPWTEPIAQEFPKMTELGMSPMEAIKSATSRAADMLEMTGKIGALTPGAYADVIAVPGDPVKDIKQLENVEFVMKGGQVFKSEMK